MKWRLWRRLCSHRSQSNPILAIFTKLRSTRRDVNVYARLLSPSWCYYYMYGYSSICFPLFQTKGNNFWISVCFPGWKFLSKCFYFISFIYLLFQYTFWVTVWIVLNLLDYKIIQASLVIIIQASSFSLSVSDLLQVSGKAGRLKVKCSNWNSVQI